MVTFCHLQGPKMSPQDLLTLLPHFRPERSRNYTVQDRYSTVPEQLTARHRTVNIGSREQPGVAKL